MCRVRCVQLEWPKVRCIAAIFSHFSIIFIYLYHRLRQKTKLNRSCSTISDVCKPHCSLEMKYYFHKLSKSKIEIKWKHDHYDCTMTEVGEVRWRSRFSFVSGIAENVTGCESIPNLFLLLFIIYLQYCRHSMEPVKVHKCLSNIVKFMSTYGAHVIIFTWDFCVNSDVDEREVTHNNRCGRTTPRKKIIYRVRVQRHARMI